MNINFYQTNDIFHKSIAPILIKILEDNKKAVIFCKDQELLKQIDDGLWSFSKTKFIPHGTNEDDVSNDSHPIFLTSSEDNPNKADYLIMFDKPEDDFIKSFQKTFYFFNDDSRKTSKDLWRHYKTIAENLHFYKKDDQGKWVVAN